MTNEPVDKRIPRLINSRRTCAPRIFRCSLRYFISLINGIRLERRYRHADGRQSSVPQMSLSGEQIKSCANLSQCSHGTSSNVLGTIIAVAHALRRFRSARSLFSPCRTLSYIFSFSMFSPTPSCPFLLLLFLHLILFRLIIVLLPPVTGASIILQKGHACLSLDPISRPSSFFLRTPPGFVYPPLV